MRSNHYWATTALLAACAALGIGCATPRFGARVELMGQKYQDASSINRAVGDVADPEASKVEVFFGSLPDGFERTKDGIVASNGSGNRILGKVLTTGINGYNADRSGYCHISNGAAGFVCLMGIACLLPVFGLLACPCVTGHGSNDVDDVELRKAALIAALQRATKAAGGNAVVIDGLGKTVTMDAQSHVTLGTQEMTEASGWAVQLAAPSSNAR
jgi:hypothetical protein